MIAKTDFSARWNGRTYEARKGEEADLPQALEELVEEVGQDGDREVADDQH